MNDTLCQWENIYGTVSSEVNPELRFKGIIRRAYEQTGQRVVILVEEYDKPMLQAIGDEELQNEYRNTLKAFYSVMKTQDRYIRFGFLTGVTKFGKVSVFNDLNNLIDLSMDRQFQTLCGMTDKEIHTYFEEPLHRIAENYDITYDEACRRLKEQYDGYRFRQNGTNLYNPFSLLNTFRSWSSAATGLRPHLPCETAEGRQLLPARPDERRGDCRDTDIRGVVQG